MKEQDRKLSLFDGFHLSGLTPAELWLSCYSVSGNASELEVEAYTLGLLRPDADAPRRLTRADDRTTMRTTGPL